MFSLSGFLFDRARRAGAIDAESSLFQIGPTFWRYVEGEKAIDFYAESDKRGFVLNVGSLRYWHNEIREPFAPDHLMGDNQQEGVTPEDRLRIVEKLRRYCEEKTKKRFELD